MTGKLHKKRDSVEALLLSNRANKQLQANRLLGFDGHSYLPIADDLAYIDEYDKKVGRAWIIGLQVTILAALDWAQIIKTLLFLVTC